MKLKDIEWEQDNEYIRLKIPIVGVNSMKNVELYLSDLVFRINISEKKIVKVLDFQYEVDYLSKENKFAFTGENKLECSILKKQQKKVWDQLLVVGLNKEQLIERRKASFQRREEYQLQFIEQMKKIRIDQDRYSTQEQMRIDDEERKKLQDLKEKEKKEAEEFIYEGIEENLENQPQNLNRYYQHTKIFDDDQENDKQVNQPKIKEKPAIRQIEGNNNSNKVDIQFTEKVYKNLAAREQHLLEAPLPQLKKMAQNSNNKINMNEIKNPIWLKDKGDELMKNKDFLAAINAYRNAFKIDNTAINNISNIGLCHLQMFNYNECIQFSQKVLDFIDSQNNEERSKYFNLKIKNLVRKAICLSWKGDLQQAQELMEQTQTYNIQDDNIIKQMENITEKIKIRIQQKLLKDLGNSNFQLGNLDKALQLYRQSLELDKENETILSNISLILMQKEKYEESLEFCEKTLKQMQSMVSLQNIINEMNNNYDKQYDASETIEVLIKQLYRKAKILHKQQKLKEALEITREIITIDLKNKETRSLQSQIQKQLNKEEYFQLKQQAIELIKENKTGEALAIIKESQQKLDKEDINEYLAMMLNKCICYMQSHKWTDIIQTTGQGLNIINNHKNRVLAFKQNQDNQKLQAIQKAFLVRRANAYLHIQQFYNSKQDLEDALLLAPGDPQLIKDIQNIKLIISSN